MEILNISNFTNIFRVLAVIQLTTFIVLFFITLLFKLYQNRYLLKQKKTIQKIKQLLNQYSNLSAKDIKFLKKYRKLAFDVFFELDKKNPIVDVEINQNILKELFLSFLHEEVVSKDWVLRNKAALLLQLKNKYFKILSLDEEQDLMVLLNDSVPLIAVNAAIAVCYSPTQKIMNVLMDVFSQKRRSQYDLLTAMLKEAALQVIPFIQQRLMDEKNIYLRVFCYRMLRHLPPIDIDLPNILLDLNSKNIDLNLASLAYVSYAKKADYKDHLVKALHSDFWEIRARAAKLIGYTQDDKFVEDLIPYLKDDVWWVRYRAAEALSRMGAKGLSALKSQKLAVDKFAFEIAQQQLQSFYLKKIIL